MTDGKITQGSEMEALERLLASYGADRTRWPAPERLRFAALLSSDSLARRRLAEAEALDRLLDLAPAPRTDRAALAERIVAAAVAEERTRRVVRLPQRGGLVPSFGSLTARAAAFARAHPSSGQWAGGALLAASLVLGAFMGTSGALDSTIQPLAVAAVEDVEGEHDPGQVALGFDAVGPYEEDLL